MIAHPAFSVEPWALCETELDLDVLDQAGSVFALANGHIGLRGNLDEGEPPGLPGTYLNGFYEQRPLPYAEAGYGYPEAGQTVVNVTNGKIIRLLVDDEPFDMRFGELLSHERTLDFRAGVLRRQAEWRSPAGKRVRVSSVRLVSFVQRAVAAVLYEVEPLDGPARLVVQSELVANEPMPPRRARSARGGRAGRGVALGAVLTTTTPAPCWCTSRNGARCGWPPRWITSSTGPPGTETATESSEDLGARDDHGRRGARAAAAGGQAAGLRVVEPALDGRAARPGRRRAGRGAPHRLGGAARRPARIPRRLLGARRRRARG